AGLAGVNGAPDDQDNYDAGNGAAIRFDQVAFPSLAVLFVDSQRAPVTPPQPPSTRTASPIDFRQPDHITSRLARFHAGWSFNAGMLDGSAGNRHDVATVWMDPLP